jgi:Na+-driven multidrug efflux pump
MGTGIIITMAGVGVFTAVSEIILNSLGKADAAQWVKVGGVSLNICLGLGLIKTALNTASSLLK